MSSATSLEYMFYYAEVFNQPLENWDVSNVTNMLGTFADALEFNQPLNLWDVSNVDDMDEMFYSATSFNQPLNLWDVSNVTKMPAMFNYAESFDQDLNTWDVSNVTTMRSMFSRADSFNGDITNWDVSSVTTMRDMFSYTLAFNQDISGWNVGSVTTFYEMFQSAESFNHDIGNWDTSNVENMVRMFDDASAFNQSLADWDLSSIPESTGSFDSLNDMFGPSFNTTPMSFSIANYDATLIGWNTDSSGIAGDGIDDIPQNIAFGGGQNFYCTSESERQNLIDTHGWNIEDQGALCSVMVQPIVFLQGAFLNNGGSNFMRDDLRVNDLIPTLSPYDGVTALDTDLLLIDTEEAIVDWVLVELRDATDNTNILFSGSFLLQREGSVIAPTGGLPTADVAEGDYYVVVKHRNHLGVMTANPIALNGASNTEVTFFDGSAATFGTDAQTTLGVPFGFYAMWAGDGNADGIVQYSGGFPDTTNILSNVLNDGSNFLGLPTHLSTGYSNNDVNMDGNIQYAGGSSELPFILQNVLSNPGNFLGLSTWPINEQLPNGGTTRFMEKRNAFENSKH